MGNLAVIVSPVVLKVFLYRHNHGDRMLISELREYFFSDGEQQYVRADDMRRVVEERFADQVRSVTEGPAERLPARVNSAFFLSQILAEYSSVKFFNVQVLDDELYTRELDGTINFDYSVVYSKVDLAGTLKADFMARVQRMFKAAGLYNYEAPSHEVPPYFDVDARVLVEALQKYADGITEDHPDAEVLRALADVFTPKLGQDDAKLLVVMRP